MAAFPATPVALLVRLAEFSPGRNENNQPVRVKFTVPVRFKLNEV